MNNGALWILIKDCFYLIIAVVFFVDSFSSEKRTMKSVDAYLVRFIALVLTAITISVALGCPIRFNGLLLLVSLWALSQPQWLFLKRKADISQKSKNNIRSVGYLMLVIFVVQIVTDNRHA